MDRGSERKVPHIGTETRSKLLREAAVRNIGQWTRVWTSQVAWRMTALWVVNFFYTGIKLATCGFLYAPYVIYIWCTEKTRTVNIDIDRFGILEQIINWIVGKRYYYNEEFDPGSGWTLATGLTHASRGASGRKLAFFAGDRRTGE